MTLLTCIPYGMSVPWPPGWITTADRIPDRVRLAKHCFRDAIHSGVQLLWNHDDETAELFGTIATGELRLDDREVGLLIEWQPTPDIAATVRRIHERGGITGASARFHVTRSDLRVEYGHTVETIHETGPINEISIMFSPRRPVWQGLVSLF